MAERLARPSRRAWGEPTMMRRLLALPLALLAIVAAISFIYYSSSNAKAGRLARYGEFLAAEQPQRAYQVAQEALQAWPTLPEALTLNAQLEYRRGKGQRAVDLFQQAIEFSPSPGTPMRLLGVLLVNNPKTLEEGIDWMLRGMRLAPPRESEARLNWMRLAEASMQARKFGLAIWAYNRAEMYGEQGSELDKQVLWAYESLGLKYGARSR